MTRLVSEQGARLVAMGLAIGLVLALAAGRSLASLLFGVEPTDVPTIAAVLMVLLAAIAIWLPIRRAARVDPLLAIRDE